MDAETQRQTPKLRTNLDTNFLKLFAILTMVVDHVGTVFFPQHPEFRWVGRLAFPIFCYCLTVGLMYTRDIRRYLGRLALFAVVSQPFLPWPSIPTTSGKSSPAGTSLSLCFSACWPSTA